MPRSEKAKASATGVAKSAAGQARATANQAKKTTRAKPVKAVKKARKLPRY